jgi:hypothetical protein
LGKLFAAVLDRRLGDYLEEHQLRSPFQGGFRQGYGPMDQAFVLNHIIEAAKHSRSQVYCAFVDFSKAFDTVRHEHLWDRLRLFGVGGNFLRCVQSMYDQAEACAAVNGQLSGFERTVIGVRQGDPLSPTLFALYIDTLAEQLKAGMSASDTFAVGGVPVYLLLYADDLVLIAAKPAALQCELDILAGFCADWDLTVNMKKTNTVVFNPQKRQPFPWRLGATPVVPATQYKYLGLVFDARKGLRPAQGRLVDSGRKALFGMMGICCQQGINDPSLRQHMWNALVLPVLSYGAELWAGLFPTFTSPSYFKATPAEKIHTTFLRWVTGAGRTTHRRVLPQAAGRLPLAAHWGGQTASFWNRLVEMDSTRLTHLAFRDSIDLMHRGADCWAARALGQFRALGIIGEGAAHDPQVPLFCCRLDTTAVGVASNRAFWHFYENPGPRSLPGHHVHDRTLHTFASWFLQLSDGLPVHHNIPAWHWRRVLRFCTGTHPLQSSMVARHAHKPPGDGQRRIPAARDSRCRCCTTGADEDELHFMLECPAYTDLRQQHAALFVGSGAGTAGMRSLFQRVNFSALSAFIHAGLAHRETALEAHSLLESALLD